MDAGARGSIAGTAELLKLFVLLGLGCSGGNLPISIGLRSKWDAAHHRRGKKAPAAEAAPPEEGPEPASDNGEGGEWEYVPMSEWESDLTS